jgi:membrane protein required for colicin V production
MNLFDLFYLIPALWGLVRGFMNGIIKELALLAALCLGIFLAGNYADELNALLKIKSSIGTILCFSILFLLTLVIVFTISSFLTKVLEKIYLGTVSKLCGAAFGALKYLLIMGAIVLVVENGTGNYEVLTKETKTGSFFYKPVQKITILILPGLNRHQASKLP